jgi:hypothetical protein
MTLIRLLQYKMTQHTSMEDLFVCRLASLDVATSTSNSAIEILYSQGYLSMLFSKRKKTHLPSLSDDCVYDVSDM